MSLDDLDNPYASTLGDSTFDSEVPDGVMAAVIDQLRQTRPWVRLVGFLLMIAAVFMGIAALGMLMLGAVAAGRGGAFPVVGGALLYGIIAVIYGYAGLRLITYGRHIKDLEHTGYADALVAALAEQRKFWRIAGIGATVMLIFMILGIVFGILGAAF